LRGSSAKKARDLARWFKVMNWAGDGQNRRFDGLNSYVQELRQKEQAGGTGR
jgi:hypothetical protein